MNLVFHQLKIEIRRQAFLLLAYLLILAASWAHAAGHLGGIDLSGNGSVRVDSAVPMLTLLSFVLLFPALIGASILADSPAEHDGFLSSRPLPARALYWAKALFIALGVVAPAVATEMLSIQALGEPVRVIWFGGLERLLLLVPAALVVALFCCHWRHPFSALLAGGVALAVCIALVALTAFVFEQLRTSGEMLNARLREPSPLSLSLSCLALAVILSFTLHRHVRRRWKPRVLAGSMAVAFIPATALSLVLPLRTIDLTPITQKTVDDALPVPAEDLEVSAARAVPQEFQFGGGIKLPGIAFNLIPDLPSAPASWELRWSVKRVVFRTKDAIIHRESNPRFYPQFTSGQAGLLGESLSAAIEDAVPDARVILADDPFGHHGGGHLQVGHFVFNEADRPRDPVTLEAELVAVASEWKLTMDVPLPRDEAVRGAYFTILPYRRRADGAVEVSIMTGTRRPLMLATTSGYDQLNLDRDNLCLALYLPGSGELILADNRGASWTSGLSTAGQALLRFDLRHRHAQPGPEQLKTARLLVFQARELGAVTIPFTSDPFTVPTEIAERPESEPDVPKDEEITEGTLALWLHESPVVPADGSADQVLPHLQSTLAMAHRASSYHTRPGDFLVRHLARYVPRHLDLFLGELRKTRRQSGKSRLLVAAIAEGARPAQARRIASASADFPELINALIARGWFREARDQILADGPYQQILQHKTSDVLLCLVAADDPEADAYLLEMFEGDPRYWYYEVLRKVPRLQERVEEIARAQYHPSRLVLEDPTDYWATERLRFGLGLGHEQAVEDLFVIAGYAKTNGGSFHIVQDIIGEHFALPRELWLKRHEFPAVRDWFFSHRPGDFVFDPVLGKFATRPESSS